MIMFTKVKSIYSSWLRLTQLRIYISTINQQIQDQGLKKNKQMFKLAKLSYKSLKPHQLTEMELKIQA